MSLNPMLQPDFGGWKVSIVEKSGTQVEPTVRAPTQGNGGGYRAHWKQQSKSSYPILPSLNPVILGGQQLYPV